MAERPDVPFVHIKVGDVLDQDADLLVLPATARGGLGAPWQAFLGRLEVSLPIRGLDLAGLLILPGVASERARRVAVVATVRAHNVPTEPGVVLRIAEQLGKATTTLGLGVVVTPMLGTGAGRLPQADALRELVNGFMRLAAPGARLHIVVQSSAERDMLDGPVREFLVDAMMARIKADVDADPTESADEPVRAVPVASKVRLQENVERADPHPEPSSDHAPEEVLGQPEPGVGSIAPEPEAPSVVPPPPTDTPLPPVDPVNQTATGRTRLVHDQPAEADQLGRASLATEVASLLRELADSPERSDEAFAVHLDAPWGAGKSSLVGFVGRQLATPTADGPGWTVIELDAWRSSQLSPAWWALLGHLREGVRGSLSRRGRIRFSSRRFRASARRLWRIWVPPAIVVGVLVALGIADVDLGATMPVLTALIAFTVAIGGLGSKFLSLGSLQGARVHERLNENPMEEVSEQIWAIRQESPKNILLVLDDLDRCNERFAVELLDAVQTLLRRGPERSRGRAAEGEPLPALVVLAVGDGRWLRAAYEDAYKVFSPYVSEPGRPLGHLFLDKLFQLRIELPTLNRSQVSGYLSGLLDITSKGTSDRDEVERIREKIQDAPHVAGDGSLDERMTDLMAEARSLDESQRQELAKVVLEARRNDPERATRERHILEEFAELLEPNPRATKRFLMAYNVAFAARLAELEPPEPTTLALWTVMTTRWPALAEWVRGVLPDGDLTPVDAPGHPSALLRDPDVRAVVGSDKGGPLDRARVLRCCGYVPEAHPGGPGLAGTAMR